MKVSKRWAMSVNPGDFVMPHPRWNNSERPHRHMDEPAEVLAVDYDSHSQTGVAFLVQLQNGERAFLDAAWFKEPKVKP